MPHTHTQGEADLSPIQNDHEGSQVDPSTRSGDDVGGVAGQGAVEQGR